MSFAIFDSTASLVDSFDDRDQAREALAEIMRQDPDAAADYAVLEFDDDGQPVADALTGVDLGLEVH
jgi:hypothetical protein